MNEKILILCADKDADQPDILYIVCESTATLENSLVLSYKVKYTFII